MADWQLTFRETTPITEAAWQGALAAAVGPVTVTRGPFVADVDPREGGTCAVTLAAGLVELQLTQFLRGPGAPVAAMHLDRVTLRADDAPFAARLATRDALRAALLALGCTDDTLALAGAPIVDDADAAGATAAAARLRAESTAALVAMAPSMPVLYLSSPRADLEAVLAAYPDPGRFTRATIEDSQVRALPAALARFANITELCFTGHDIDASALRVPWFPQLTRLVVRGTRLTRVGGEDLAGFPRLAELFLHDNPLAELGDDLVAACPGLARVVIARTPLARSVRKRGALRARWPGITWK